MRKLTPSEEAIAEKLAEPLKKYAITNGIFKNKNIKLGKMGGSFTIHLNILEAAKIALALKYGKRPTKKLLSMFEEMLEYIDEYHQAKKNSLRENQVKRQDLHKL